MLLLKVKLSNQELAEELHKPIIRNFETWKVQLCITDNIWGVGFADMQLISKFNKGISKSVSIYLPMKKRFTMK